MSDRRAVLQRRVRLLVLATISYNVVEAVVALVAGAVASSIALIGFGLDSVIEVGSAAAVAWQFAGRDPARIVRREQAALRVIAWSFFVLAAYVTVESLRTLLGTGLGLGPGAGGGPEGSTVGIVLVAVSVAVMPALSLAQRRAGRELGSASAVADSQQTLLCTYLSVAVLAGLVLNAVLGWWWADPAAGLVLAALAVREGRNALRGDSCCAPTRSSTPARPEADLPERPFALAAGDVLGRVDGDVVRALGMPYAQAARFAPPVRLTRYEAPITAFQRAPAAPQLPPKLFDRLIGGDDLGTDENCQRLSVTAPADLDADERLPVLVWIHGGGNVAGAGDLAHYDPRALVAEQRVVVVTVTYRLGMLGFLGDGAGVPANVGLLDQLAALRWVRDNIAAFGGDPDSVTVFGQSSGADAIAHLMISDGAEGLFRRVIMQSAPLGVTTGRAAMSKAMLAAVGELSRDAPVEEILALQPVAERAARRFGMASRMPFGVQYGLPPLPDEADRDAAWRRAAQHVDVLIGSTLEETGVIAALVPALTGVFRLPVLGGLARRLIVTPSTRSMYETPARWFVARHRAAGGRAHRYRMTWRPDGNGYGAAHLTDLPLLLGTRHAWEGTALLGSTDWADVDRRGRLVRRIWAEFARTGTVPDIPANDTITFPPD